jgi:hypothetical protein
VGNDRGRSRRISGDHDGAYAKRSQFRDERSRVCAGWVTECDKAHKPHGSRWPRGYGQNSVALLFEFIGDRSGGR